MVRTRKIRITTHLTRQSGQALVATLDWLVYHTLVKIPKQDVVQGIGGNLNRSRGPVLHIVHTIQYTVIASLSRPKGFTV